MKIKLQNNILLKLRNREGSKLKLSISFLASLIILNCALSVKTLGQVSVLTQHNNNARTGLNNEEKILNINNVNKNSFGKIGSYTVDDEIYAQPLIVSGLDIPGKGKTNVLFVATVNNSVYAFDADEPGNNSLIWQVNFNGPDKTPVSNTDLSNLGACNGNYTDFSGNIGIVGTPVIDTVAKTIYLVARTKEYGNTFLQRLHALNIIDGTEEANSPVIINGSVNGTGTGNENGIIKFNSLIENQRPALLFANDNIYISWGGHCDVGPFHGWMMAYHNTDLTQVAVYNNTRNGGEAGIWMSGQGPACDDEGNIYAISGNGTCGLNGDNTDASNLGDSFIKLNGSNLTVADWFTPYNYQTLESTDRDLGSSGPLLIPNTNLVVSGGKQGVLYLVNKDSMGKLNNAQNDDQIVQSFLIAQQLNNLHGSPPYYNGPTGEFIYTWVEYDYMRAYKFDRANNKFLLPASSMSPMKAPDGMPGGMMSVSSNGTMPETGIVWATHPTSGNANWEVRPGTLHAFDATDISKELWSTQMDFARDDFGNFAKFSCPTVANGKVYLSTFSKQLVVYGLLDPASISKGKLQINFQLSPMPVNDYLSIAVSEPGEFKIRITDVVSRTWINDTYIVDNNNLSIYLGNLNNGIYFITVEKGGKEKTERIVIAK